MKSRIGFVSNSSSSSFIVAFPSIPHSVQEILKLLYDNNQEYLDNAEIVFKDLQAQNSLIEEKKMVEELCSGYFFNTKPIKEKYKDLYDSDNIQDRYKYWEIEHKEVNKTAKKYIKNFIKKNKDCFFYCVNYGDESGGIYSELEHEGTFDNLPHIRISHH